MAVFSAATRDAEGLIIDGRDGWPSTTAFQFVHDAIDAGNPLDAEELAVRVWQRFCRSTDLSRPKKDGSIYYGFYDGHIPTGGYRQVRKDLLMRDESRRAILVIEHEDPIAELLRAAVCDDEVIQAIGRGRGVNRIDANSLEMQVLADVALPLAFDRVIAWDGCTPDIIQQMLLAGGAVDSPSDAAVLHTNLVNNAEAAKKTFQRAAHTFRGQIPILSP